MESVIGYFKGLESEGFYEFLGKAEGFMYDFIVSIQSVDIGWIKTLLMIVSDLINPMVLALVALIIYWSMNKKTGISLALSIAFAVTVNTSLKLIFKVPRPYLQDSRIIKMDETPGYSFPSGHSQQAGTYAVFMYKVAKKKWIGIIIGLLFVMITTFSRMYLGMHTLLDVTVGALLGVVITIAMIALSNFADKNNNPYLLYFVSLISGIAMIFSGLDKDLVTMTALSLGAVTGYILELKYISYSVPETTAKKVLASLIGLVTVGIVKLMFMFIPGDLWYIRFIDYAVFGFSVTAMAPYLIKKIL